MSNNKSKTIAAKNNNTLAVIKSPRTVPATQEPPDYAEFDRFAELGQKLADQWRELGTLSDSIEQQPACCLIAEAEHELERRPYFEKLAVRFQAFESYYSRDALRDLTIDEDTGEKQYQIKASVVSEQMALLIGSFPNAGPHSPEVFTKMLIVDVTANNPHPIVLEAACRLLRRTKNFLTTIAEVLKAIDEEGSRWCDRWEAASVEEGFYGLACAFDDLASVVAHAKKKLAAHAEAEAKRQAEAKLAVEKREAEAKAAAEKRKLADAAWAKRMAEQSRAHEKQQLESLAKDAANGWALAPEAMARLAAHGFKVKNGTKLHDVPDEDDEDDEDEADQTNIKQITTEWAEWS
jgi:hypothetical protein